MDPESIIRRLKSEILMLREEISFLKVYIREVYPSGTLHYDWVDSSPG